MISKKQLKKAAAGVLKLCNAQSQEKAQLLPDTSTDTIICNISLKVPPAQNLMDPIRISIPHSLLPSTPKTCLFATDRTVLPQLPDHVKVITLEALQGRFKPYAARRELLQAFELFCVDSEVFGRMISLLGKVFGAKKRFPHKIDLQQDVASQLQAIQSCTFAHIRTGPNLAIVVGTGEFERDQIVQNVLALLQEIERVVPEGGWKNVQALYLKGEHTLAVPFYSDHSPHPDFLVQEKEEGGEGAKEPKKKRVKR